MTDDFDLERKDINDKLKHGFTQKGLLSDYRDALADEKTSFLPCLNSAISSLYAGAGQEMKLYLDEALPSIKINNIVIPITRIDNPRVLIVGSLSMDDLMLAIISLIYTKPLSDKERVRAYDELINLGLKKAIIVSPQDFVAKILGVTTKTLVRDLKNAE